MQGVFGNLRVWVRIAEALEKANSLKERELNLQFPKSAEALKSRPSAKLTSIEQTDTAALTARWHRDLEARGKAPVASEPGDPWGWVD